MALKPGTTKLDKSSKVTKSATKDPSTLAKAIFDDLSPTSSNNNLGRIKDKLDKYSPIPAFDDKATENQIHDDRRKFCKAIAEAISEVISKEVCKHIIDNLEIDGIICEVKPGTIVTAGSPTTQTGPAGPIPTPQLKGNSKSLKVT